MVNLHVMLLLCTPGLYTSMSQQSQFYSLHGTTTSDQYPGLFMMEVMAAHLYTCTCMYIHVYMYIYMYIYMYMYSVGVCVLDKTYSMCTCTHVHVCVNE